MPRVINGFYAGYFTAAAGNGFAIFAIKDGVIAGADLGVVYDGSYEWDELSKSFIGAIKVSVKPGGETIQGVAAGPEGMSYTAHISLTEDFDERPFVTFVTPIGAVNARFEKLRDL